jgi:hypothetical protein
MFITICRLRRDVEAALQQHKSSGQPIDDVQWIATFLGQKGYQVAIRTALGGGEGFECLKNLRHVFLTVTASSRAEGAAPVSPITARSIVAARPETYVVDLSFKEQVGTLLEGRWHWHSMHYDSASNLSTGYSNADNICVTTCAPDLLACLQFAIAKPTERYTAVLDCLPAVYVAPERAVAQLVQVRSPMWQSLSCRSAKTTCALLS